MRATGRRSSRITVLTHVPSSRIRGLSLWCALDAERRAALEHHPLAVKIRRG
jgi:hypothetical protein